MDCLKKKHFLSHDGRSVDSDDVLRDKGLILFYFSAAWCPESSSLLHTLHKIYDENKRRRYGLEIIYVSADTEYSAFSENFKKQHGNWYAIPFTDSLADELRFMYNVTTIPTVVVVNKEGTVVSRNGKEEIETNGINVLIMWTP